MLLVVDIGNTNVVLGVFDGQKLAHHWRMATRADQTGDEFGIFLASLFQLAGISLGEIEGVIICSVVPPIQATIVRGIRRYLGMNPLLVGPGLKTGIAIRYDNPRDVGADRIVNAVAAYELVKGAAIVVDFGTATTFDLVGENGDYLGGAIAPGLALSMNALSEKTAKLPRVELVQRPPVVGRNTVDSIQSGMYWGYVGLVEGLLGRMIAESGFASVRVLATGGLARMLATECSTIAEVDEFLTLNGLRLLYERNRQ
ncbi:MAG: type III pantothenate kinase [Magnetococcales bacterium]|nr:type III pantothenate kinase [Magnetococcales bacterium]MBF0156336.1 type III pantothenate kinase [Magnetococcales bacterium]